MFFEGDRFFWHLRVNWHCPVRECFLEILDKLISSRMNLNYKSSRNWQYFQICFWFSVTSLLLVLSILVNELQEYLLHYPLRDCDEADRHVLPQIFFALLEGQSDIWLFSVLRNIPKCHDLSKIIEIGLAETSESSLSTYGCIQSVPRDLRTSSLLKCYLTWISTNKGKSSLLQTFLPLLGPGIAEDKLCQ